MTMLPPVSKKKILYTSRETNQVLLLVCRWFPTQPKIQNQSKTWMPLLQFQILFENLKPKSEMKFLGFLFSLFLVVAFPSLQPVCGNAELGALMNLKSSLDPEGKVLTSWTSDGDPCSNGSFEGVACNEDGRVVNITLPGKGLSGSVSPAVAELKCLSGLYLHYNHLSGEIPREISNLTQLVYLYLDENYLSGSIPSEVGHMASLQDLQLCCNKLVGSIPTQIGSLKQLSSLSLQSNKLSGSIPPSLGTLRNLRRLDLSFNNFSGRIPATLADIPNLEVVHVQNNSLSGVVPSALRNLKEGFKSANNPGLCGVGFSTLRDCTAYENVNINNHERNLPEPAILQLHCNQTDCSKSRRFPRTIIAAGVITTTITLLGAGFLTFARYRRREQKNRVANTSDSSEGHLSPDQPREFYTITPSPLVNLDYSNGWDTLADGQNRAGSSHEYINTFRFNMDEVESATQYLSEANLLGKSKFSAVYKGILRDASPVAIRSITETCCKTEEAEFINGLNLLTSLRHGNLVKLRGFCCSRSRGECFLIYDFAPNGNLSQYLDVEDGSDCAIDWTKRVSIIKGIAKGIEYLHSDEANKPAIVHQNLSVEKIVLDHQFNPLIMDAGLPKLLADDVVFSALKVSAAMGYLAPEYITTGRFTEKIDIYAFGVILLQVLSGKKTIGGSIRVALESFRSEDFVDSNLKGRYSKSEAEALAKLAMLCTHEHPDHRPTMKEVIQELHELPADS